MNVTYADTNGLNREVLNLIQKVKPEKRQKKVKSRERNAGSSFKISKNRANNRTFQHFNRKQA
jgi:putative lipoic acid-binding regulatory protein